MESSEEVSATSSMEYAMDKEIEPEGVDKNQIEDAPTVSQSTHDVLKQQLQETLNLIVLNNKVDLSTDLKTELNTTIKDKVAQYTLDNNLDVLEIQQLQITNQISRQNQSKVQFEFEARNTQHENIQGHGTARIIVNAINIDNEVYQEYQIYFENIVVE